MFWHCGICRSAAFSLNLRPQCGQGTREGSGADATDGGSGAPDSSALVTSREVFIAWRNISLCCFHFDGVLGLGVAARLWLPTAPRLGVLGAVCGPGPAASFHPWWELELFLLGVWAAAGTGGASHAPGALLIADIVLWLPPLTETPEPDAMGVVADAFTMVVVMGCGCDVPRGCDPLLTTTGNVFDAAVVVAVGCRIEDDEWGWDRAAGADNVVRALFALAIDALSSLS